MSTEAAAAPPPRREGIRVGRLLGVPVFLKPSWLLVALLITLLFAPTARRAVGLADPAAHAVAFGFAVLLLVSVLVHELAHAVAARATGTPARAIVLDVWGGHTAFDRESAGPWRSVLVAAVGPAANLALALAVLPFLVRPVQTPGQLLLVATASANLFVAAFNALPGLPLDGGHVLEALVWRVAGNRHAGTVVAGWCGRAVAVGLAGLALAWMLGGRIGPVSAGWLLLIAAMLWQGATRSLAGAAWRRRAAAVDPASLLRPAVAVPSDSTVQSLLLAAARDSAHAVVLLDVYGRPSAVVDERAAGQVAPSRAADVRASAVAEPLVDGAVVDVRATGEQLIARLQEVPAPRYAVLDGHERVVGVLEWDDVERFVSGARP